MCTNTHEGYEKIGHDELWSERNCSISGEVCESYPIEKTTTSSTAYASTAGKQAEAIVNVGERYIRVVDDHGAESLAKFQMCKGLGQDKILGSVSMLVESVRSVVSGCRNAWVLRSWRWGKPFVRSGGVWKRTQEEGKLPCRCQGPSCEDGCVFRFFNLLISNEVACSPFWG